MIPPKPAQDIAKLVAKHGGTAQIVGGWVRDQLLGIQSKDLDIEVFQIPDYDSLATILKPLGPPNKVGKSFGVIKLRFEDADIDVSLPRSDSKTGKGHTGFDITIDPLMSPTEAASRRDFTINSIAWNLHANELVDPFNGQADLEANCLRHINDAFPEDPLRVLRAMQFAARFELTIAPDTIELCKSIDLTELPKERLFEEFKKLLLKAKKPSIGLSMMHELGIDTLFPEITALYDLPQDPEWHPEGDVWTHTLMVVDEMAKADIPDPNKKLMFMLAALCHDFGKASTTEFIDGRWRSRNHEKEGIPPTTTFLKRLTDDKSLIDSVLPLVKHHLKPALLYKSSQLDKVGNAAIRRLSTKVNITDLVTLARSDHFGRSTPDALAREFPAGDWLLQRANKLNVAESQPTPFLTGKDLIDLGYPPGPKIGKLLREAYAKQLEGKLKSKKDAIDWAQRSNIS